MAATRAGGLALSLLAVPLNAAILQALSTSAKSPPSLRAGGGAGERLVQRHRAGACGRAAAQWEHLTGVKGASPISAVDVESAFLLATPPLRVPRQLEGTCRFVVEVQASEGGKHAGALVTVERGRVASCVTRIHAHAESWVAGSPSSWLYAVIKGRGGAQITRGS